MRGFMELIRELGYCLADNKRWWLAPIVITMSLLTLRAWLQSNPVGLVLVTYF